MKTFTASLSNELRKITSRKKFLVFLIIEIAICLLTAGVNCLISSASKGMISKALMMSNMPLNMLSFFIQIYIPLLILMACSDLFAGEVHDGTIRASFMRPVSRFKLYASKVTAVLIMAAVYIGILLVLTTALKALGTQSIEGLSHNFLAYLLDIVPLLVLILFVAMFNQFSSAPSLSMIICIIIYIGLYILGIILPQMSGLVFTGYLQWHNLWLGVTLPFRAMAAKIGLLLGYGLIFGGVGYYLFERKEV